MTTPTFRLVTLRSGAVGIRSDTYHEVCHPGVGPKAEAEALYVRGLDLPGRFGGSPEGEEFVVWDVGLGGAANATSVVQALSGVGGRLRLISFDCQLDQLRFALQHATELGYFADLRASAARLLDSGNVEFFTGRSSVRWQVEIGDFPTMLDGASGSSWPAPHAVLWDPHSPSANPEMWTRPLFRRLFERLDPARPCALATYSRSTSVRAALLLAGFRVGAGASTASKEESTVAANRSELIVAPLGARWLERAGRSHAAEPWGSPPFETRALTEATRRGLRAHPQFAEAWVRPG